MKNRVYGLVSMIIKPNGEKIVDGTLLCANEEKAEKFMQSVNKPEGSPQDNNTIYMKGSVRAHYEHGQWYVVTQSIADSVHSKNYFYVRNIDMHTIETNDELNWEVVDKKE